MKYVFRLSGGVCFALILFLCAVSAAQAQTDPVITQITASALDSFANGISGDGRFVVIESRGNIATENPGNADGNLEIFLFDYAQRRIFQITNTTSRRKSTANPAMDPANPANFNNIAIEVANTRPVISHNGRWIAFSSNAPNPAEFDGDSAAGAALATDGNMEIWLYFVPAVPPADLSSGDEQPLTPLTGGAFTRITDTPASRVPAAGTETIAPFIADDNRAPFVNDNASLVAFVSTRNITNISGVNNADFNPEIFIYNRANGNIAQVTNTQSACEPGNCRFLYSDNPNLSGDGTVLAFISNANPVGNNADFNGEIFVANFSGTAATGLRQVTGTAVGDNPQVVVNLLSPGRGLSRNGNLLTFESAADLTGNGALQSSGTVFIYNITANTFTQVGPRPPSDLQDVTRFPTFTGDSSTIVFTSRLNFRADGTIPTTASEGLNPDLRAQIFAAPVSAPNTFTRLTNTPAAAVTGDLPSMQAFVSNTLRRIAFSLRGTELGGSNTDRSSEAYYLLTPTQGSETPAAANAVAFFTGASERPVVAASSASSPTAVTGLTPGMLGIGRSTTVALAPSIQAVSGAQAGQRRPHLPVELNGVSVSIRGAAAGLYFVSGGQINFVVPPGLEVSADSYPVVINNNGAVIRSTLRLQAAQHDVFPRADVPGNRATVFNVTNRLSHLPEPPEGFSVTSSRPTADGGTETAATELMILTTGLSHARRADITVRIGTIDIMGDAILFAPADTPASLARTGGFDAIIVRLPAALAGAGDLPIVVTVTSGGQTTSSRPADAGAPVIRIR